LLLFLDSLVRDYPALLLCEVSLPSCSRIISLEIRLSGSVSISRVDLVLSTKSLSGHAKENSIRVCYSFSILLFEIESTEYYLDLLRCDASLPSCSRINFLRLDYLVLFLFLE